MLMLEPLHACNLTCTGCGRIREYAATVSQRLSLAECLAAVDECGAPVVSICGGEPLIYPGSASWSQNSSPGGKHVYLCTNGVLLEKKLEQFRPSSRLFINVHLDGMEETHDRLVGRKGVFAAAVRRDHGGPGGRLPSLHEHDHLQRHRHATRSPCSSVICASWASMA